MIVNITLHEPLTQFFVPFSFIPTCLFTYPSSLSHNSWPIMSSIIILVQTQWIMLFPISPCSPSPFESIGMYLVIYHRLINFLGIEDERSILDEFLIEGKTSSANMNLARLLDMQLNDTILSLRTPDIQRWHSESSQKEKWARFRLIDPPQTPQAVHLLSDKQDTKLFRT